MADWRIPLSDLDYGEEETAAVQRVLQSRWLSMGLEVQGFEREFAALHEVEHAVAVANGTAALHLSLLALGVGHGDEVIQPAINFVAAANMTIAVGASPVFADIVSLKDPTVDPVEIEERITPRTKAVVVMHYGGYFCKMAEIQRICDRHGLHLVEDACHAVGARYLNSQEPPYGPMAGSMGDAGCFSFFSNKNLAVGEGGMITTHRDDVADRLRLLRSHGMTSMSWDRHKGHASSYNVTQHGFNYRLDEIRAALGRCQLTRLPENNERRRRLVDIYRQSLKDLEGWTVPFETYSGESSCHLMVIVAPDEGARARVVEALQENRIQSSLHYPCIPDFSAFFGRQTAGLSLSRAFARRVITLPLFPGMSSLQVEDICQVIRQHASVLSPISG